MRRARRPSFNAAMNITPLIDVVFILLVFFMLATNFARYRMIGVDAPPDQEAVVTDEGAVVILLEEAGTLRVDGDPRADGDVLAAVEEIIALDPNRAFLVRPEPGVDLQVAITAYDAARRAGAGRVSFSRDRSRETGP